jgi:hypothetical protein
MWAQRPIVEKQSRYAFYHPGIEAFASISPSTFSQIFDAPLVLSLRSICSVWFAW